MAENNLLTLYNTLSNDSDLAAKGDNNFGEFEEFKRAMQNPDNIKSVHDYISTKGDYGTLEDFSKSLQDVGDEVKQPKYDQGEQVKGEATPVEQTGPYANNYGVDEEMVGMPTTEPQKEVGEENLSTLDNSELTEQTTKDTGALEDAVNEGKGQETEQLVDKVDKEVETVENRVAGDLDAFDFSKTDDAQVKQLADPKRLDEIEKMTDKDQQRANTYEYFAAKTEYAKRNDALSKSNDIVAKANSNVASELAIDNPVVKSVYTSPEQFRSDIAAATYEVNKEYVKKLNDSLDRYDKITRPYVDATGKPTSAAQQGINRYYDRYNNNLKAARNMSTSQLWDRFIEIMQTNYREGDSLKAADAVPIIEELEARKKGGHAMTFGERNARQFVYGVGGKGGNGAWRKFNDGTDVKNVEGTVAYHFEGFLSGSEGHVSDAERNYEAAMKDAPIYAIANAAKSLIDQKVDSVLAQQPAFVDDAEGARRMVDIAKGFNVTDAIKTAMAGYDKNKLLGYIAAFAETHNLTIEAASDRVNQLILDQVMGAVSTALKPNNNAEYWFRTVLLDGFTANLGKAAISLAAYKPGDVGLYQLEEKAMQDYEKEHQNGFWNNATQVSATLSRFVLDNYTGAFTLPGLVAKGGTWILGGATEAGMRSLLRSGGKRLLSGTVSGALNFMSYETEMESLRQLRMGDYSGMRMLDSALRGAKEGAIFGAVGGTFDKMFFNARGWQVPVGEVLKFAAEGGTFATFGYLEAGGNITIKDLATSYGMALVPRMQNFSAWASDVNARFHGKDEYGKKISVHKISKEEEKFLSMKGYDIIGVALRGGALVKSDVERLSRELDNMRKDESIPWEYVRMADWVLNGRIEVQPPVLGYKEEYSGGIYKLIPTDEHGRAINGAVETKDVNAHNSAKKAIETIANENSIRIAENSAFGAAIERAKGKAVLAVSNANDDPAVLFKLYKEAERKVSASEPLGTIESEVYNSVNEALKNTAVVDEMAAYKAMIKETMGVDIDKVLQKHPEDWSTREAMLMDGYTRMLADRQTTVDAQNNADFLDWVNKNVTKEAAKDAEVVKAEEENATPADEVIEEVAKEEELPVEEAPVETPVPKTEPEPIEPTPEPEPVEDITENISDIKGTETAERIAPEGEVVNYDDAVAMFPEEVKNIDAEDLNSLLNSMEYERDLAHKYAKGEIENEPDNFRFWAERDRLKDPKAGEESPLTEVANAEETPMGEAEPQQIEQEEQPKEESSKGLFGTIYNQFKGKAQAAIYYLLGKGEGIAKGALHHPQVGDIDLWYGNEDAGLKKIADKHPEVLDDLQGILDGMEVKSSSDNRIILESPTHRAVVSRDWFGKKADNWLLTAYEKKDASGGSIDIVPEPESGKQNGTAPLQDNLSEGKGSTEVSNVQEKVEENSPTETGTVDDVLRTFEENKTEEQPKELTKDSPEYMPMRNKGNGRFSPDWEKATADQAFNHLLRVDEQGTTHDGMIKGMIDRYRKKIDELDRREPKIEKFARDKNVKNPNAAYKRAHDKWERERDAALAQYGKWQQVKNLREKWRMEHNDIDTNGMSLSQLGEVLQQMTKDEDVPYSGLEDYVLRSVAFYPKKFRWSDKNGDGLGRHLGFENNPAERRKYLHWISNDKDAITPTRLSEILYADAPEYIKAHIDQQDMFNAILDAVRSHTSRASMLRDAIETRKADKAKEIENSQAAEEAAEQQYRDEKEAEQYATAQGIADRSADAQAAEAAANEARADAVANGVEFQKGANAPEKPTTKRMRDYTARTIKKLRKAGVNVAVATKEEAERMREIASRVGAELMSVFHGSGARFDAFDHSHMGEGEGAQAYGWGTYVTQVFGIARSYAKSSARGNEYAAFRGFDRLYQIKDYLKANFSKDEKDVRSCLVSVGDIVGMLSDGTPFEDAKNATIDFLERKVKRGKYYYNDFKNRLMAKEAVRDRIENMSDEEYANLDFNELAALNHTIGEILDPLEVAWLQAHRIRNGYVNRDTGEVGGLGKEQVIENLNRAIEDEKVEEKNFISDIERDKKILDFVKDFKESDFEIPKRGRFIYDVEIPDNDGTNYLSYTERMADQATQFAKIKKGLTDAGFEQEEIDGGDMVIFNKGDNRIILRQVQQGRDLYAELSEALDGDKAASEFLRKCGIVGIKYPAEYRSGGRQDGAMNFVIFNEADAKITNVTEFMQTSDGTIYGWHDKNGIHLTEDGFNPDTPVHEYTHGFMRMLKERDPKKYERVVAGLKDSPVWEEVLKDPEYQKIKDDETAIASEVASRLSGRENVRRANTEFDHENYFSIANAIAVKERVKNALQNLWDWVLNMLWKKSNKAIPYDRVARMTLRELEKGTNVDAVVGGEAPVELMGFAASKEDFDKVRDEAVKNYGIIMPGLASKDVVVVDVPIHDFEGEEPLAQAEKWAKENLITLKDKKGKYLDMPEMNDGTKYAISNKAVEKYLSESGTKNSDNLRIHLSVLKKLKNVIHESIEAEIHPDYKKDENGVRSPENGYNKDILVHRLYGAVEIEGKIYRVKTTMLEYADSNKTNKPHSYEVKEIKLVDEGTPTNVRRSMGEEIRSIEATNLLQDVEKSYGPSEKLIKDNEKTTENGGQNDIIPEFSIARGNNNGDAREAVEVELPKITDENKDNKDVRVQAMKAIGGNLSKLRQAMSKQREYDRETVQLATDFAKQMIDNGLLSGMTDYEVKQVMTKIKNATGKEDITKDVNKLVDLMIKHQLKEGKNTFVSLLNTKASRVDSRGVVVAAGLDDRGERTLNAVKQGLALEPVALMDRINDVIDKLNDPSDVVRENAEAEYDGLTIAQRYIDTVKQRESYEAQYKQQLEDAKERHKNGQMSNDEYKQLKQAAEELIRDNRIGMIEDYGSLAGSLGYGIETSKENLRQWREQQRAREDEIRHDANRDMEGRNADINATPKEGADKAKALITENKVLSLAQSILLSPLGTFDTYMRYFGSKFADGVGNLYNRFVRGSVDAKDNEWKAYKSDINELDAKAEELFGKKAVDMYNLQNSKNRIKVTTNTGEYDLNQLSAAYIYCVNKQADGRMKLRYMGIDDAQVQQITSQINPKIIQFFDWVQDDFLPRMRDRLNETHKRMYGASMDNIVGYFPLRVNMLDVVKNDVLSSGTYQPQKASTTAGGIMKRTVNNKALDITRVDALQVLMEHIQEMEHWNAFAEFSRDLNTLLGYKRFETQVKNSTSLRYGNGDQIWDDFVKCCQITTGDYSPSTGKFNKDVSSLTSKWAASNIAFRFWTAMKQLQSGVVGTTQANWWYLTKDLTKALALGPNNTWNWAIDNLPLFAERWQSRKMGETSLDVLDVQKGGKSGWDKFVSNAARWGITPNAAMDGLTVAVLGRAIYETRLGKYRKWGYTEDVAQRRALQDAAISVNETQQSSQGTFKSVLQTDRDVYSRVASMYRNASMGYERMVVRGATSLFKNSLNPKWRKEAYRVTKDMAMRDGLSEAQADRVAKSAVNREVFRGIANMVMFGAIAPVTWTAMGKFLPMLFTGQNDEDKLKEEANKSLVHAVSGFVEGLVGGATFGDMAEFLYGKLTDEDKKWSDARLPENDPLLGNLKIAKQKATSKPYEALYDTANLLFSMTLGVNPQTFVNWYAAIADYCGGDMDATQEGLLLAARLMNMPENVTQNVYVDELVTTAGEAKKLSPEEFAERFARYKRLRGAGYINAITDDETDAAVEEKYIKKYNELLQERIGNMSIEELEKSVLNEDALSNQSLKTLEKKYKEQKQEQKAEKEPSNSEVIKDAYKEQGLKSPKDGKGRFVYADYATPFDVAEDITVARYNQSKLAPIKKIWEAAGGIIDEKGYRAGDNANKAKLWALEREHETELLALQNLAIYAKNDSRYMRAFAEGKKDVKEILEEKRKDRANLLEAMKKLVGYANE